MFTPEEVEEATLNITTDPNVGIVSEDEVHHAITVVRMLLHSLRGVSGFLRRRRLRKAIEVLEAIVDARLV